VHVNKSAENEGDMTLQEQNTKEEEKEKADQKS